MGRREENHLYRQIHIRCSIQNAKLHNDRMKRKVYSVVEQLYCIEEISKGMNVIY